VHRLTAPARLCGNNTVQTDANAPQSHLNRSVAANQPFAERPEKTSDLDIDYLEVFGPSTIVGSGSARGTIG
jgi:hypothetical protein